MTIKFGADGDALSAQRFSVEIDGEDVAWFREASGLGVTIEVVEHTEQGKGGVPITRKTPGSVKWDNITLKRGKTDSMKWWKWIKDTQEQGPDATRKSGSVIAYDYAGKEVCRWNFREAWPAKVSMGQFSAETSEVAVEEVEIVHHFLEFIPG